MNASGKSLVLGGLLLVATAGAAMAQAPCTAASFAAYAALGSTGCTIGDKTFNNFAILANSTVETAGTITVTPVTTTVDGNTAVGVAFNGAFAGSGGGTADISFRFNVTENNPTSAITAVQLSTTGNGSFCEA